MGLVCGVLLGLSTLHPDDPLPMWTEKVGDNVTLSQSFFPPQSQKSVPQSSPGLCTAAVSLPLAHPLSPYCTILPLLLTCVHLEGGTSYPWGHTLSPFFSPALHHLPPATSALPCRLEFRVEPCSMLSSVARSHCLALLYIVPPPC